VSQAPSGSLRADALHQQHRAARERLHVGFGPSERPVQDLSCTGRISGVDVRIAVGVAQALTPHGDKSSSETSTHDRGVQDLSCTGRISGVDVRIAVGVAQALTPHGDKSSSETSTSVRAASTSASRSGSRKR